MAARVAREIMPREHRVRAWLKDRILPNEDAEDLIQEAYAKLASVDAFGVSDPELFARTAATVMDGTVSVRDDAILISSGEASDLPAPR